MMRQTRLDVPSLRRPAAVNAAEYWLAPDRFARRCERLGDRFQVAMPSTGPWLCLTHPDDIKKVFLGDTDVLRLGEALAKLAPHPLVLGPTGLTNVDGADHTRRRRVQNHPFNGAALTNYQDTMQRKTEEALAQWPYGQWIPAQPQMQAITLEVIIAVIFGVTDRGRVTRLRDAIVALIREAHSRRFLLQTVIATSRTDGWNRPFPRMRRAMSAVDAIVLEEVAQRRNTGDLDRDDVLGIFLRTTDDGAPMSDDELCDAMRTMLLGGHETTASTLTWLFERITRHPDILARTQAAAREGDDDYLDAVIKEAMRLRPVAPMTCRLAATDFELPGLTVPAGTIVFPYITLVHRREDIWEDPLEFRPQRFLNTPVNAHAWIPFGGGRRRCLGAAFSLVEARVVLRTILRNTKLAPNPRRSERISRSNVLLVPGRGGSVRLDRDTMARGFAAPIESDFSQL